MNPLAPLLERFFTDHLMRERHASPNTIAAYRDVFRLLLRFVQERVGKAPSDLQLCDLDAPLIGAFLDNLEKKRNNSARTRNARLAAIHSFFRYLALLEPAHSGLIQRVLAIPQKRCDRVLVTYLTRPEVEALLAAPDRRRWIGRRDYALMHTAVQTGLRVSELIQLRCQDVCLASGAHLQCLGKGRKQRCVPLSPQTVATLRAWLGERKGEPSEPLFPNRSGMALSRDAVERLLCKYAERAGHKCASLRAKRVSPHVLRHTSAMNLLQGGADCAVIALWLGHESIQTTQIYLHADLTIKENALARTSPPNTRPGRYLAPDPLLAFLEGL